MMEAVRTSEMSVHYNETIRRYIPEGSTLATRSRWNLKSHDLDRLWMNVAGGDKQVA